MTLIIYNILKQINVIQLYIVDHHYPTPKQIRNILKPYTSGLAARWHDLGTELLTDDTVGILDVIKIDHPNDAITCCNKMFVKWLELQPNATWSQLITALCNIGMNTAAEVIKHSIKGLLHKYKLLCAGNFNDVINIS